MPAQELLEWHNANPAGYRYPAGQRVVILEGLNACFLGMISHPRHSRWHPKKRR